MRVGLDGGGRFSLATPSREQPKDEERANLQQLCAFSFTREQYAIAGFASFPSSQELRFSCRHMLRAGCTCNVNNDHKKSL